VRECAEFEPSNRAEWRRWLRVNGRRVDGVWLVYQKGAARPLTYAAAVEEALCFGWIDTVIRPIDSRRYKQLFTPRKPKSTWSALNKRRVERLIAAKQMTKAGLAKIGAAKRDGSWASLDLVEAMVVPDDLARAFARNRKARAFFDGLSPSSRKGILHWVNAVKTAGKRAERIAHVVAQGARGLRPAHHEAWLAKARARAGTSGKPRQR